MQIIQVKAPKNADKQKCASSPYLDEKACLDRSDVEWVSMHNLDFANYSIALIEAKQSGWSIPKRPISQTPDKSVVLTSIVESEQSPAEREFEKQVEAFNKIPASELERYHGQFVAVLDGEVVDSDYDPIELSRRFFEKFGGIPVYKTRIGEPMEVNIPAPFLR